MEWIPSVTQFSGPQILFATFIAWLVGTLFRVVYKIYFHPLSKFPGPRAAAATSWWKTYVEMYKQVSMVDVLPELHATYGDIVRVGPNELHFSRPSAYHEIYNNKNKWDKESVFYRSFGEDESSFGYLTYRESKERKDVLGPLFSRSAIINMQFLIHEKIDALCNALKSQYAAGQASDLFFGFRCFTMDTITSFCFARSVNAINEPEFKAPIIEAMEAMSPTFVAFRHFAWFKELVLNCPPWLSLKINPTIAGMIKLQILLGTQIKDVCKNPKQLEDAPHPIIYHALLNPDAHRGRPLPSQASLYHEAQALMFAGSDTVGTALMVAVTHIVQQPKILARLQDELHAAWPSLEDQPTFEVLEKLPFLTAIVKESLRITPGVIPGMPRVVPSSGTMISDTFIPGGTTVSQSAHFVHKAESIFHDAKAFTPDRWLQPDSKTLDTWLVTFSKGPRSCLGISLAYCELYIAFANVFRRFDLRIDETRPADLTYKDCFIPLYTGQHLYAFCKPKDA